MNARRYIPDRGDIVRIDLGPREGEKRSGRRHTGPYRAEILPALVVSPREYNRKVGLAQFCPITSDIKGYPFEVLISGARVRGGSAISGVVLSDQIRSFDWRARNITRISRAPANVTEEVLAKISVLLGEAL